MLIVLSGPGGVGKDTLARRLVEQDPSLALSRSWTTRPHRPGEPEDSYVYVDRATFVARESEGGFLEFAEYLGNLYGTPCPDPNDPRDLILVIEVQGAEQVLKAVPDALMILLVPPTRDDQAARLRSRGDPPERIRQRVQKGVEEEEVGRRLAHYVVVNDDLDRAVSEVAGILAGRRSNPDAR